MTTDTAAMLVSCGFTPVGRFRPICVRKLLEALHREGRLDNLVAGAVEADHQPVADQLVAAHAGDPGDVLDALRREPARRRSTRASASSKRLSSRARMGCLAHRPTTSGRKQWVNSWRFPRRPQNGTSGLMKKRVSQPGVCGSRVSATGTASRTDPRIGDESGGDRVAIGLTILRDG
jgi:hypothetical protein